MTAHAVGNRPQTDFRPREQTVLINIAHLADMGRGPGPENEWTVHREVFLWLFQAEQPPLREYNCIMPRFFSRPSKWNRSPAPQKRRSACRQSALAREAP